MYSGGLSAHLHHCTACTACSECGSTTHQMSSSTRSRDISTKRPTLAACSPFCHVYIVCTEASGAHRQQSIDVSGLMMATVNIPFRKRRRSTDINCYELLTTRLKFSKRCFSHARPKAWNELPTELQDLTDHSAFRRKLKTFLFECMFTTQ